MPDKISETKDFQDAAQGTVQKRIRIDAEVADWLKAEFGKDWQSEVNGLLRFYMDTNRMTPPDAEPQSGLARRWEI